MAAKPPCAFGAKCYRKNPQHLANFSHPDETEALNKQPSPVNNKSQSEPNPPTATRNTRTTKRTAATVDEEDEEEKQDTSVKRKPPSSTAPLKRAKTDTHTASTKKQPTKRKQRHTEDVNQSDEDIDDTTNSGNKHSYQPLTALNTLTSTERWQYFDALFQSMYRLVIPEQLYTFRQFLIALHIQRTSCDVCTADGVLQPECVDAVMRLVPAVDGVAGVECCGVLDWMCGRFDTCVANNRRRIKPWLHWRYFYDLPELMTLYRAVTSAEEEEEGEGEGEAKGGHTEDEKAVEAIGGGWHCGYWRDAPEDEPPFLVSASNYHPAYTVQGRTIFHATHRHLLQLLNTATKRDKRSDHTRLIQSTIDQLLAFASAQRLPLTTGSGQPQAPLRDKACLARQKRVLAPTFTSLGFVCPYDATTQVGFRPLPIEDAPLRAMVERMESERVAGGGGRSAVSYVEWDGVVTLLSLAMDECDPGTVVLFYQQIYCCEGAEGDGVRVVEGEVSSGMGSGYEMTGGESRVHGWKRCIAQQMKYRYRRLLSQIDVAKRAAEGK